MSPRRALPVLALAALAVSCAAPAARAQDLDPTVRPNVRTPNCTINGCHAATMEHQFLHGPTAVADCRTCHDDVDVAQHSFVLRRQGRDLCDFCHIDKTGTEGPVVHKPLADGDCLACHDPHGSASRQMIKFDTTGRLIRHQLGAFMRDISYDAADRISAFTHYEIATGSAGAPAMWRNQSFNYDELNRLNNYSLVQLGEINRYGYFLQGGF